MKRHTIEVLSDTALPLFKITRHSTSAVEYKDIHGATILSSNAESISIHEMKNTEAPSYLIFKLNKLLYKLTYYYHTQKWNWYRV